MILQILLLQLSSLPSWCLVPDLLAAWLSSNLATVVVWHGLEGGPSLFRL